MIWLLIGLLLIAGSGLPGLLLPRASRSGERLACALLLSGTLLCSWALVLCLNSPERNLSWYWAVPTGQFALRLDSLAAAFLAPLLLVVASGAIYGLGYWPQSAHTTNGRKLRLFYGLISGAMILLLLAHNGILFLCAWETMALSGYFLITTEDHKAEARRAGYIYLIATHCGTLALIGLFALLEQGTGSALFPATATLPALGSGLIFLLGLFGFGMKAGLMPLHIWLPGAHAAAPSHASALLSGVIIKMGIYGLLRLTSFYAEIPAWWGWTLLLLGAVSGVLGVTLAIAQHDIKRLLAYHSVENIGIITLGLALALLGRSYDQPTLVVLGLSGCLLHVANHGLFKALLFLSAGAVIHTVGSREFYKFGGLLKRQRWTGLFFLGGAVAICGLPPFNGFVSEWLIYLGAFQSLHQSGSPLSLVLLVAPVLALIGGLALACFVKVFGISFLGTPRSAAAAQAQEAPRSMLWPMGLLLLACAAIGLQPTSLQVLLEQAASDWSGNPALPHLTIELAPLSAIGLAGWLLSGLLVGIGWQLQRRTRKVPRTLPTWGCSYPFAAPRMQYSASSFADSLLRLFHFGLWSERRGGRVKGLFPARAELSCHTPDLVLDRALIPTFTGVAWLFRRLRRLIQNGVAAIYLLYVALTLLVLLTLLTR
jgi:hydrogenase-4 component B